MKARSSSFGKPPHFSLRPPVTCLLALVMAAWPFQTTRAAERQVLSGHIPTAITELLLQPLDRLSASTNLNLAVGLPLRNKDELNNLLQQLYDPASPQYHQYLTPEQFTERFGPTEQDYQALIDFVQANGLTVTGRHPGRTLLDVKGPVPNIERMLHVTMHVYQHPTEARTFYSPDVEPSLDLDIPVLNISGLNNYVVPRPKLRLRKPSHKAMNETPNAGSGPGGAYSGNDFRAAYLQGATALTGAGQVVGLVEFDGYFANDITMYRSRNGLSSVALANVLLDGFNGTPTTGPDSGNGEVALDIEMAISMAPGLSKVIVYEAGPSGIANDVLSRMASDNQARQLSCSWSFGVFGPDPTADQFFQQMAAQGQSFFNAAGDSGAFSGSTADLFPADDPYITQVGGTTLTTTGPGGNWASESVWNDGCFVSSCDSCSAGGGGISTKYAIPSYQQGISMSANQGSTARRNIPDVAMVADDIAFVADNGQQETGEGTSFAAPLWAAYIALANQQAVTSSQPPVGFLNPAIYGIGEGPNYNTVFHDIATGNNTTTCSPDNFFAVVGYDLCTGWGSPNRAGLITAFSCGYTIAVSSTPSGGGTTSGGGAVTCGSEVTVTATPGACFNFSDWTENSTSVSTSPSYTFTAVTNRTLVANFTPTTSVQINTDSSPAEGGITSGGGSVTCGSSVTVFATPNENYSFVNWTESGGQVSTSSNYTFTATSDLSLVANFLCSSPILPTNVSYNAGGGTGTVSVADALGCVWTASSGVNWIEIQSGTSGSISGVVNYTVASNVTSRARTGTMTIAGQTFTVEQAGSIHCFIILEPTSFTFPSKGGSKTLKVENFGLSCDWTAFSNDPFITITEGASGTGNGKVSFTVPGNTNTVSVMGTMTIAGQPVTVDQAAGGCAYSLSPKSGKFKAAAASKTVKVKTKFPDCAWSAVSNDAFITITNGVSGTGKGVVAYTIPANMTSNILTGSMTIAGQTFTIIQSGVK
jgi:subtilase family serine protease